MPNRESNLSTPLKGLNRDSSPSLLNSKEVYTFALNARQESEDGNQFYLSNEASNTLSLKYSQGFKVIGFKNIEDIQTIVFLTNPDTGDSEIGTIKNDISNCIDNIDNIEDIEDPCIECTKTYKYPINQGESIKLSTKSCQSYTTIVSSKCLNFHTNHPVHKIDYKATNQTIEIYWTDNYNKMKWMDINNPPLNDLGELDCNAITIFPDYTIPCIHTEEELNTGTLKTGVYQFFVAYANSKGEELSQYYSPTNPASIWDNQITNELSFSTSKSIRINISNLDTRYKFINIAVAETIESVTSFKLIGFFDLLSTTFDYIYTGNDNILRPLTSSDIFFKTPIYIQAETLAVQNSILMLGGVSTEKTINYQSVANKIVLQWEDYILPYNKFEGYHTAQNTANYRSYLRDEVYAFEFVPLLKSGKVGNRFHIPGPRPKSEYFEIIGNQDANNFKENPCDDISNIYRWQVYNTATLEGYNENYDDQDNCYIGPYRYGNLGFYQSIRTYPNNKDIWGELAGTEILHHKMPGINISNIFSKTSTGYNIHPLGIKVNKDNIINAINESDLSQEDKDNIIGFQIVRATRTGNNSIIAKGILYNVGEYERDNEKFFYPNYPYNDLGKDPFISKSQPKDHSGPNDGNNIETYGDVRYEQTNANTFITNAGGLPLINSFNVNIHINGYTQNLKFNASAYNNVNNPNDIYYQLIPVDINQSYNNVNLPDINITPLGLSEPVFINIQTAGIGSTIYNTYVTFMFQQDITGRLIPTTLDSSNLTGFDYPIKLDGIDYTISGVTYPDIGGAAVYEGRSKISKSGGEDIRLDGFNKGISDIRYNFISPNTTFNRPPLAGNILKIESVLYGNSTGYLTKVKDDPKYSISTVLTIKVAVSFAVASILVITQNGGMFGSPTVQINLSNFTPVFIQTLDLMNKLVPYREYGYQYLSIGKYDNSLNTIPEGNTVRNLELAGYIDPGMQSIGDIHTINNFNRESSVYLRINNPLPFAHEYGVPVDNSRFNFNSYQTETGLVLQDNERVNRNISSLYGSIKRRLDDQYNEIYSYRTISTGQCFYLNDSIDTFSTLFGGDTFINQFAIKRKVPFFLTNMVKFPDGSDVAYDKLGNIGYPTYWLSTFPIEAILSEETIKQVDKIYKKATNITIGDAILGIFTGGGANVQPFIKFTALLAKDIISKLGIKNTNFDRYNEDGISELGTFYLFSYGIPIFFVESDINVDLRQAENSTDKNFYPNVGTDIPQEWLEEANISISKDNFYLYNRDFSKQNLENFYTSLERDYDPNKVNQDYFESRVIYSEQTNLEEKQNNWLVFKANNYYDFPLTNGKLIDLNTLEENKVLARFEDNISVYNAYIQLETDNKNAIVGTGSMFSTPPQEFSNVALGYLGTQHKAFVTSKYGYFWLDAKRGEIFQLGSNNSGLQELSKKGNSNWFKENLPFHIKKYFPNINLDNSFNSVGISMCWDSRYERLFVTKKDYIPLNRDIIYDNTTSLFYINDIQISLSDTKYFKDASWTIAYSPKTESWVSHYSFIPDYYIEHNGYFQTGINKEISSLWNHNLTNKSYQVFYNNLYPFEIECITNIDIPSKTLQSVQYRLDVLRYSNGYDYKLMQNISFDQAEIYNISQTSGILNLDFNVSKDINNTNKIINSDSSNIQLHKADDIHKFNQFYDVTKDANSNLSLHEYDTSNVYKNINSDAVDYTKLKDIFNSKRLKGDYFNIKLSNTKQNRYKFIFKWLLFKTIKSFR